MPYYILMCFFLLSVDHRALHVLTHSFPTRLSSDLPNRVIPPVTGCHHFHDKPVTGVLCHSKPTCTHPQEYGGRGTGVEIPASAAEYEDNRSEEHTSELQLLMRTSYAVICLKQNIILMTKDL